MYTVVHVPRAHSLDTCQSFNNWQSKRGMEIKLATVDFSRRVSEGFKKLVAVFIEYIIERQMNRPAVIF